MMMVQYPHIDERQRGLQLLGQHAIRAGRLGDARGMLVGEDHRGGIQLQHSLHDDTWIDRGRVDRAPGTSARTARTSSCRLFMNTAANISLGSATSFKTKVVP